MPQVRKEFYDFFKALAIIFMVIDHIGNYFLPDFEILRVIGRMAAPIFFFLVGYSGSTKIDLKILFCAVILQFSYLFYLPTQFVLNILFTILFLRFANRFLNIINNYQYFILILFFVYLAPLSRMAFEYGSAALIFSSFGFMIKKGNLNNITLALICLSVSFYAILEYYSFEFSLFALIFLIFVMILLTIMLVGFEKFNYDNKIFRFLANHALLIYLLHKLAFKYINYLLMI